jgi:hypothetical protein
LLKQPLLVAWRPRAIGFWILIDPSIARAVDDESLVVDLNAAIKNDLLSILAGDYYIVPKQGAGMRFEIERVGDKQPTADGYEAVFRFSDAYIHDAAGTRINQVPNSVIWAIFSVLDDRQEVLEDQVTHSFVASGGMTRAQLVLRTAIGFWLKEGERINWKSVGSDLDAALGCDVLLHDVQARFGTFISYVFYQQPQEIPSFLPDGWAGRAARADH